jgi:predicted ribosome quality control (RQC) complex YloA/Tae2 family protein
MTNHNWQKGINDLKEVNLKKEEKALLLQRVLARATSPNHFLSLTFFGRNIMKNHVPVFVTALLLVMTGSLTVASETSLPGDVLYPVKISITEPARDLIKVDQIDKIEWQAQKATRRLEEANILSEQAKLDEEKIVEIENLFEKHTQDFKKASEQKIEKEYKFGTDLNESINVRVEVQGETDQDTVMKDQDEKTQEKLKEKEIEKKNKAEEKNREKIEKEKEQAKQELEKKIEKMEKAKEKALKKVEKRSKGD